MKFLVEASKLLDHTPEMFDTLSYDKKEKYIDSYLKSLDNYKNIEAAIPFIKNSIFSYGIDPNKNEYLNYIVNLKDARLPREAAMLIYNLSDDDELDLSEP